MVLESSRELGGKVERAGALGGECGENKESCCIQKFPFLYFDKEAEKSKEKKFEKVLVQGMQGC